MEAQTQGARDVAHGPIRDSFARLALQQLKLAWSAAKDSVPQTAEKQAAVLRIINAYRTRGHKAADLDPLQLREPSASAGTRSRLSRPERSRHGVRSFNTGSLVAPAQWTPARNSWR
jgi:2-oxoglutarate dehydrogenase E1 component